MLALVGENDVLVRGAVDAMAQVMSNLAITVIPDANHVTAVGHPRFALATLEFLRSR